MGTRDAARDAHAAAAKAARAAADGRTELGAARRRSSPSSAPTLTTYLARSCISSCLAWPSSGSSDCAELGGQLCAVRGAQGGLFGAPGHA